MRFARMHWTSSMSTSSTFIIFSATRKASRGSWWVFSRWYLQMDRRTDVTETTRQIRAVWINHLHFLEEVPVGDDFQLLQNEEDATTDEEGLMFDQSFIEEQEVPLADTHKQRMTMVIYCIFTVSVTCVYVCVFYLTALVTSANCIRSYFFSSWCVGMWPWEQKIQWTFIMH